MRSKTGPQFSKSHSGPASKAKDGRSRRSRSQRRSRSPRMAAQYRGIARKMIAAHNERRSDRTMREAHRHDRRSVAKSERDDAPPQSAPICRASFVDKSASVVGARIERNHRAETIETAIPESRPAVCARRSLSGRSSSAPRRRRRSAGSSPTFRDSAPAIHWGRWRARPAPQSPYTPGNWSPNRNCRW